MEERIDENSNIIILHKIPLEKLIENLHAIYEQGVDFIDLGIVKDPDEVMDTLKIGYTMDYFSIEALEKFNENNVISDKDIDDLI